MSRYAKDTDVSPAKSRAEIEDTLTRYGCTGFMSGWQADRAMLAFQLKERQVKFLLPMPDPKSREITHTPERGLMRTPAQQKAAHEQAIRQRWRALALAIKAKLEAVECGIVTFDQEFLAHIVGPNGQTVGDQIIPMIEANQVPRLCLG